VFEGYMADVAQQVREHIGGEALEDDPINGRGAGEIPAQVRTHEDVDQALDHLTGWTSDGWESLPELTIIRVHADGETWLYTMLANRIYTSHDRVYFEGLTRVPEEDSLSINRGIIGSRPGLFIDVNIDAVDTLVTELAAVDGPTAWASFVRGHGQAEGGVHVVDRRDPFFWTFLDEVHEQWFAEDSVNAAVLDVSEYVWPQDL
jgi:hypothetical protein